MALPMLPTSRRVSLLKHIMILIASKWPNAICRLLMVQHFVSGTIILLIMGCSAQWAYFRYLNKNSMDFWRISSIDGSSSVTFGARSLLVLTSILDAARNSTSLFLLLIVSMGYGVVRPSVGPIMTKVRILTGVHFVCGVLYSVSNFGVCNRWCNTWKLSYIIQVGIVLILTESGGSWIFLFIFPLAFTLTAFMMWTLHSLNATIEYLTHRKQSESMESILWEQRLILNDPALQHSRFKCSESFIEYYFTPLLPSSPFSSLLL